MKGTKMLVIVVLALGLMVWSAPIVHGAQYLTVNGEDVNSITLELGQSCTVEVVSDDSNPYNAYVGFDNGVVLGDFTHVETKPEAGNLAGVTDYNVPAFYGYFIVAAGSAPAPSAGVHFVLAYSAQQLSETELKLYDGTLSSVIDSVHITIVHAEMGTAFSYQGRLLDADSPADGLYDFEFELYDAPSDGNQLGSTTDIDDLDVVDGYLTVVLDFNDPCAFNGDARWLEVGVRPGDSNDPNAFVTLSPRQELTPAPYAIWARRCEDANYAKSSDWINLTNVPAGFADGVDNDSGGDITAVNAGTGLNGGGTAGNVTLSVKVPLVLSGSVAPGAVISGTNIGNGYGLYGKATELHRSGVYGEATGRDGKGVYGYASRTGDVTNYGGYFKATGASGTGVYGKATGTGSVTNYGGYFEAAGEFGKGVRGYASGTSGKGGSFRADGTGGVGVHGYAGNDKTYTNYGGYFEARGTTGRGVFGYASHTGEVTNYGGYFETRGRRGRGVYGYASYSGPYGNYGGYFEAAGDSGGGVHGSAVGKHGRGVSGYATHTGNYSNSGGYFKAQGVQGRGVYGWATGSEGAGVKGYASDEGNVTNYGVYGLAKGSTGRGVYGEATGSSGRGVHGTGATGVRGYSPFESGKGVVGYASGSSARGVSGYGGDYDFYAYGPGTNYGSSSSIRWKRDIRPIDDPLGKVLRLRGVYFNWDAEHGGRHDVGMVAEEVGEVLPEIVEYEENGIDASGMDYGMLAPLLVEAVKVLKIEVNELQKQNAEKDGVIDALKQQNDKLEGRLATLESSIATIAVQLKGGGK